MLVQEKKAAFSRGLLELLRHPRCPAVYCLGAAGFAAPAPGAGFGAAGLAPAPAPVVGAATPDCALYRSTTAWVISNPAPASRIGLCGHGFEVSIIMPKPLSCAYLTTMGAIFCRILLAISCCWVFTSSWKSW